jgi:putative Ca2+/H+ antiporter (TMEM165/GDT1 family)
MDWKLFLSTFGMIFLAELGDKTQLSALTLTANSKKPVVIFLAASSALIIATLLGVLVGDALFRFIPEFYIRKIAALVFVVMGILLWFRVL